MNILARSFNDRLIRIRQSDRYVSGTDMAQAANKLFADWNRLKSTTEYLQVFEESTGIPLAQLVQSNRSQGANERRGTWLHPQVAIRFAQWLSVDFSIQVDKWIHENADLPMNDLKSNLTTPDGFVYLVKAKATNYYKIGASKEVYRRLKSLQVGTPLELIICDRIFTMDCKKLEKALHEYYDAYSIRGEWFNFSKNMAKNFLSVANDLNTDIEENISFLDNQEQYSGCKQILLGE
jgi:hypothetical protein